VTYEIIPTPEFIKQAKALSRKNKFLADDLENLRNILNNNPKSGISLGKNCYKIRLANSSNKKGKSGGYRVISYFIDDENTIRLLLIFSKSDIENISDNEIMEVLKNNDLF
jgi:mRNA-degrading endonuclease RelE of RelBE toxin-antitoxin system